MLVELTIRDFAIIESITIGFGTGLNIFTGETGAGKSIIIDAIALVLGDRASNDIIRGSRDEAVVEAMFDVSNVPGIEAILDESGIPGSEELVIRRVIQRAGRNKIYINGSLATLVTLSEIGRHLIDIYGQSEHTSLARPDEHIELLDAFGGFRDLRDEMAVAWRDYVAVKNELEGIRALARDAGERVEFLEFQKKELLEADLKAGEDVELAATEDRLRNADLIKRAATEAESEIYSDDGSITERLGAHVNALKEAAGFDERLAPVVESIESCLFQIEDASAFLRDYAGSVESDPSALEEVNTRLALIQRLKKKYAPTIEEILERLRAVEEELSAVSGYDERIRELDGRLFSLQERAVHVAGRLTEERAGAAGALKERIEAELAGLGMKGAVFEVMLEGDVNPDGTVRLGEKGADRVGFLISPNAGEEVKPLAAIASGGELSRIMLAIKRVSAAGRVPTLVFDEIDTGVGGAVAQAVGLKLNEVSRGHQVICITHLPQIAAFADGHYSVAKARTAEGRTVTTIRRLDEEGRIVEISSMLGGLKVTDVTRDHARELCQAARKLVEERDSGGGSSGADSG